MDATTRHLERIFDQTIQYQVPLFQRPYVWAREKNLEPLWEDIQVLLDKHLRSEKIHPHFLGAVVLEQLSHTVGGVESRQVIDGQQRFTTLQIFLLALRDHAVAHGNAKYIERFADMVTNRENKVDSELEIFKIWPTNSDREAFKAVHTAKSPAGLAAAIKVDPLLDRSNVSAAYLYFHEQLSAWLSGQLDDEEDAASLSAKTTDDRFDTLWQVVRAHLQFVVIDLDKDDETQVIFETLNARGEELLPADLIKNLLFRRAVAEGADVEKLYERHWQRLETTFWRQEVVQGRLRRPRIDVFISHYLTLMTQDDVKASHLFNAFKAFALHAKRAEGSLIPVPTTAMDHIAQLARYSEVFAKFSDAGSHARLATFLLRLAAVDTATVYPFLLHAHAELMPDRNDEFDAILGVLESFLVRRMICGLTPKNYNRLFLDLVRAVDRGGELSAHAVHAFLSSRGTGDSVRFPDDDSVVAALNQLPFYGRLPQYKVRSVLEALDSYAYHRKSEAQPLPSGLEIEHVLPRSWTAQWPLPSAALVDPPEEQRAAARRNLLLHTIGNLTLITGYLNPALSNSGWRVKRPELLKFSKLNLTQYFHGDAAADWTEEAIEERTRVLAGQLLDLWPSHVAATNS